jgi:hypothetical protein
MGKFWMGVARFFAVLFAIAFVVLAMVSLLLVNIDRGLLNAGTYKNALARQQVYSRVPRILAEQLVMTMNYDPCTTNPLMCEGNSPEFMKCAKTALGEARFATLSTGTQQPGEADKQLIQPCIDKYGTGSQSQDSIVQGGGPPPFMKSLTVSDWETVISTLFLTDKLKAMTENLLDQVFAYLNGQQDTVKVSLVDLKSHINSQAGMDAILEVIRAQPACTPPQIEEMQAALDSGQGEMLLCRPPEDKLAKMVPQIRVQVDTYASQIPDSKIVLSPDSGENSGSGPFGGGLSGGIRMARLIMRLSPDLPLLLLLFVTLLAVRTPKGWLRWWGIPLFFSGLLSLGLAISTTVFFEQAWLAILANRIPPYLSLGLVNLGHDLLRAIFQTLMVGIIGSEIFLLVLGLGMWIGSGFIKRKIKPDTSPAPIPPAA